VQGINDAAKEKNITADVNFSWEYGASFSQSAELQTMLSGWYANGTEVIFCSGGSMCLSAFAAASANDGAVIGVDVDQSKKSDTVVTSALKGISQSVLYVLKKIKSNKWDDVGGKLTTLGAKEDAVGLPTENWKLKNFSVEAYRKLLKKLKNGEIKVDRDYEKGLKDENFSNVKLNII
ncbi:MAG: BMP family ABC transporter substrate-binding protein, partial [Clostridia bacterium]|nr:BMP family ABC transporter substrate-binding protein [Clostridia bacterium]